MKTICILVPHHWGHSRGGAEYQAHLLAEYLSKNSDYAVVYLARYVPTDPSPYSYAIHRFNGVNLPGGLRWGRSLDAFALYSALRTIKPDIIVHMVASAYTGIAAYYSRRHGCQLYWYLASDMDVEQPPEVGAGWPGRIMDRALFKFGAYHADYVIAQTKSQASRMLDTFGRDADLVLSNFLPIPPPTLSKGRGFVVCWIASLKQLKRPELFLALVEKFPPVTGMVFRMAGQIALPSVRALLETATRRHENFQYLGELTVEEVEMELEGAHLFINTSDYEGVPNVFIQAWLRSTPVFTINVDPDGIMEREKIGLRTGSFADLVGAVERAAKDPESVQQMGANARNFAVRTFGIENIEKLIHLMDKNFANARVQTVHTKHGL